MAASTGEGLVRTRRAATATSPEAAAVAADVLTTGNAVDAVVAGVLAAAAVSPSVLLGPVQILVGGFGSGLLSVDGRTRQPGRGADRPRGFLATDDLPQASRIGVPGMAATLASVLALASSWSLARAVGPAVELAKKISPERAKSLKMLSKHGGAAFSADPFADELVAACGRVAGGILTRDDLYAVIPTAIPAAITEAGGGRIATVPWGASAVRGDGETMRDATTTEIVAATDPRGLVAIACYESPDSGLRVPELGLVAPFTAEPVMRGSTRVKPGALRPASAPIALRDSAGIIDLALGIARDEAGELRLSELIGLLASALTIDEAMARRPARSSVIGVLHFGDVARPISG